MAKIEMVLELLCPGDEEDSIRVLRRTVTETTQNFFRYFGAGAATTDYAIDSARFLLSDVTGWTLTGAVDCEKLRGHTSLDQLKAEGWEEVSQEERTKE